MTVRRRTVLQSAAGLTLAALAMTTEAAEPSTAAQPGDFDFLTGEWKIANRQLKQDGAWIAFDGEATVTSILGGRVSIEELRIPARDFSGMGLRVLDIEKQVWNDFWVNAKSGVLGSEGVPGVFKDGAGIFDSRDADDTATIWRGVWDQITGKSHRWYQAVSKDDGKTWQQTWIMEWTRV